MIAELSHSKYGPHTPIAMLCFAEVQNLGPQMIRFYNSQAELLRSDDALDQEEAGGGR